MITTLGVVVVSYRTPKLTLTAVRSALEAGADAVTVVDNASGDASVDLLRPLDGTRLTVSESESNRGFGTAANAGAKSLSTDGLVFLNSDAELSESALAEMLAELRRWNGRVVVGPRLVGKDGAIQRSAGLLPRPSDLVLRALGFHILGRWVMQIPRIGRVIGRSRLSTEYDTARIAAAPIDTNMVSGACFAIGRSTFEELDGFDERFFMYFEDADICRRAARAGVPIRYLPTAVVAHVVGASTEGDYRFSPMYARSMRQYLEKWWGPGGAALALLLLWVRLVGHAIVLHTNTRRAFAALMAAIG